jgi:hypothetical protein
MKQDFKEVIFLSYPLLYSQEVLPEISCGDGWFNIIMEMSEKAEKIVKKVEQENPGGSLPIIHQVKEKFGRLRVNLSYPNGKLQKVFQEAYVKSISVCEVCGGPGKLKNIDGKFQTKCKLHLLKYNSQSKVSHVYGERIK